MLDKINYFFDMKTLHVNVDIMNPDAVAKVIELSQDLKKWY